MAATCRSWITRPCQASPARTCRARWITSLRPPSRGKAATRLSSKWYVPRADMVLRKGAKYPHTRRFVIPACAEPTPVGAAALGAHVLAPAADPRRDARHPTERKGALYLIRAAGGRGPAALVRVRGRPELPVVGGAGLTPQSFASPLTLCRTRLKTLPAVKIPAQQLLSSASAHIPSQSGLGL